MSSLTKDEVIAVNKIKDTMTLHKSLKRDITRDTPDLVNNYLFFMS